jgi:hypothetical protein
VTPAEAIGWLQGESRRPTRAVMARVYAHVLLAQWHDMKRLHVEALDAAIKARWTAESLKYIKTIATRRAGFAAASLEGAKR